MISGEYKTLGIVRKLNLLNDAQRSVREIADVIRDRWTGGPMNEIPTVDGVVSLIGIEEISTRCQAMSQRLQLGISEHQPFAARIVKTNFHTCATAGTFVIDDDTLAKLAMQHPRPQA